MSGWTEERVAKLTKLHGEGLSMSQIARQLGGVTRNAVIGKVVRLGLVRETPSTPRAKPRPAAPKLRVAGNGAIFQEPTPRPPRVAVPVEVHPRAQPCGGVAILDLEAHHCRWPLGDRMAISTHFCGQRRGGLETGSTKDVKPYCAEHVRRAYQPPPAKRTANELARSLRRYVA